MNIGLFYSNNVNHELVEYVDARNLLDPFNDQS